MSEKVKHIKTPWRLGRNGTDYCIFEGDENLIADCDTSDDLDGTLSDRANAAFIVRSVNSHYALVKMLKDLRLAIEMNAIVNANCEPDNLGVVIEQIDEALKLAEADQ